MQNPSVPVPDNAAAPGGVFPTLPPIPKALDTGLASLVLIARFHGLAADPDQLAHEYSDGGAPCSITELLLAAKKLGLKAKRVKTQLDRLAKTPLPAIACDRDGRFFVVARLDADRVLIHDPSTARPELVTPDAFAARWSGELILLASRASLAGELAKFDFT